MSRQLSSKMEKALNIISKISVYCLIVGFFGLILSITFDNRFVGGIFALQMAVGFVIGVIYLVLDGRYERMGD